MNILLEADKIVSNNRKVDVYDTPEQSFTNIAKIASILIGKELSAADCTKVLIALKLVRESVKHKEDNLIDLAAYSKILNDIEEYNDIKNKDNKNVNLTYIRE